MSEKKRVTPIRPRPPVSPGERTRMRATVCEALGGVLVLGSLIALPADEVSLWWSLWAAVIALLLICAGQIIRSRAD